MSRLTPLREKHLRETWVNPLGTELWSEIDSLRDEIEMLKKRELNILGAIQRLFDKDSVPESMMIARRNYFLNEVSK